MMLKMLIPPLVFYSELMRSANQYLFSLALAVAAWLAVNVSSLQTWLLYGAHNASVSQSELDVRGWACSLIYPFVHA